MIFNSSQVKNGLDLPISAFYRDENDEIIFISPMHGLGSTCLLHLSIIYTDMLERDGFENINSNFYLFFLQSIEIDSMKKMFILDKKNFFE